MYINICMFGLNGLLSFIFELNGLIGLEVSPSQQCFPLKPAEYTHLKPPKKITGSKIGAIFWQITSRVTTKKLKIGQRGNFELGPLFSLFLMRKTLSSGQKWFLRPYFPLIRVMFLLRVVLDYCFGRWKCSNRE